MDMIYHVRDFDDNGNVRGKGGVTFALRQEDDGSIRYAVAMCHSKDNFCRRTGRIKALGRLKSASQSFVFPLHGVDFNSLSGRKEVIEMCHKILED